MQAVDKNFIARDVEPYSEDGLKRHLADPNINHTEVFPGTEENLKTRGEMVGKSILGIKKRYQKAPKNK